MAIPETCAKCGKLAFLGETVTISAAEYRDLLALQSDAEAAAAVRRPASPIDRDPEVAEFITAARATMILSEIPAACADRFGVERAPSRSAIHRFLMRNSSRRRSRTPG